MIVFPTFHTGGTMIYDAVASARKWMPDEVIVVVDSASPDRSYMKRIDCDVILGDNNLGYAAGAFWQAYEAFPSEDFYYLLHDSVIINADLTDLRSRDCTAVRWWPASRDCGWGWDQNDVPLHEWGQAQWTENIGLTFPPAFQGLFGPMLACQRHVLDELHDLGLHRIVAADKWEACAQERLWGAALNVLGYDLADGALQGEMGEHDGVYDETLIAKRHPGRL